MQRIFKVFIMTKNTVLFLLFIVSFVTSCLSGEIQTDSLPFIDVRKVYPEKEISLTDFADITYVHLKSDNDDYLYKGRIVYATNNTFVVYDNSSFSILFFSKEGIPISRFNRCGQGPEEYFGATRILYDEEADDVFVCNESVNYIQVYSSKGAYKRKIHIPQYVDLFSMVFFDNQSFLMYTEKFHDTAGRTKNSKATPKITTYYHISKTTGEVLDSINLSINEISLHILNPITKGIGYLNYRRLEISVDGYFLCNPETDTVYLYTKDKRLTPVFHKIPSVRTLDPKVVITNMIDTKKYQFFDIQKLHFDRRREEVLKYYIRDKETNEIFNQKIILPDYKNKEFIITTGSFRSVYGDKNGYLFELDLINLKEADKENRLGGKLKELVANLNEMEDNNVFMLILFK